MILNFTGNETKMDLYEKGLDLISAFCEQNSIKLPKVWINNEMRDQYYGLFYPTKEIQINMKACRPLVKTPGFDWSYPGNTQDLTPIGILSHEMGHYICDRLGKKFRSRFKSISFSEHRITGADDRGLDERMAEAARLFIINPHLLKKGRPYRYELLKEFYDPVVKHRWRTVLKNAHPKIINAVENWITK